MENKLRLTEEEIKQVGIEHGWDIAPSELTLIVAVLDAQIAALAGVPDEELMLTDEEISSENIVDSEFATGLRCAKAQFA